MPWSIISIIPENELLADLSLVKKILLFIGLLSAGVILFGRENNSRQTKQAIRR